MTRLSGPDSSLGIIIRLIQVTLKQQIILKNRVRQNGVARGSLGELTVDHPDQPLLLLNGPHLWLLLIVLQLHVDLIDTLQRGGKFLRQVMKPHSRSWNDDLGIFDLLKGFLNQIAESESLRAREAFLELLPFGGVSRLEKTLL